jgi:HEAT repeat protein
VLRTIAAKQLLFLADAGEPAAADRIGALLDDPDAGLAYLAISQLAALGSAEARARLEDYSRSGSDEGRREIAAAALERSA